MDILDKERLKECRLKLGITKQEAAKRIQISQPAYLRYEAGSRNPSIQIISKMAEVFSTSTDYLIGKSVDSFPNRVVIEQRESPSLFFLIETCRNLNTAQLTRLTAYAKKLSAVTPDSENKFTDSWANLQQTASRPEIPPKWQNGVQKNM